jgi:hypothetical protein
MGDQIRSSLGCFTIGSVRYGLSPSGGAPNVADLYRTMKNLLKLSDVIKARPRFISPATQSHHALTIRHYKSGVVTFPADTERTQSHS